MKVFSEFKPITLIQSDIFSESGYAITKMSDFNLLFENWLNSRVKSGGCKRKTEKKRNYFRGWWMIMKTIKNINWIMWIDQLYVLGNKNKLSLDVVWHDVNYTKFVP